MFEILGNIYDSSIAIVFGTVFVGTLWRLWTLFDKKFFKVLYFGVFSSIKQQTGSKNTSVTQGYAKKFKHQDSLLKYGTF